MKKTQNYNLNLPERHDVVNIDDLNENTQFIDKELYKKADKSDLKDLDLAGRTSTIVIANYDSHENSKKGADIVINKGESAAKKINDSIQSLKGTGGEVKLMEGNYNLEYGIAANVDGLHLTGIPGATILVQNANWKYHPLTRSQHIVSTAGVGGSEDVEISNLYIQGAKISKSHGFYCAGSSVINNCTSVNSGGDGFCCAGSSVINNCTSVGSGDHGFYCSNSSIINGCISKNSEKNGFECLRSSTIKNCTSINNSNYGLYCSTLFDGICAFNTLKGDKLSDMSYPPAIVEYNIIQEG